MRCFYHEDREAVGTCKSCGKGLCRECAVELPKSLACRGRCEADAQAVTQFIDRTIRNSATSSRLVETSRNSRLGMGIFHAIIGIVFLIGGLRDHLPVISILGVALIAYGMYFFYLAWRLGRQA